MNKTEIVRFFDRCAPDWDAGLVRKEDIIAEILDRGGIRAGIDVLDVACGTGVLFPDYLKRGVHHITAIDISQEMVKRAAEKFPNERIEVICGDVETTEFDRKFDAAMVYNAFPHFPDPKRLVEVLASHLKQGGYLTIAHSMSRAQINAHHSGTASAVSRQLLEAEQLAELMSPLFEIDAMISNDKMYLVTGVKKALCQ